MQSLLAMAMQFQEIIALPSHVKISVSSMSCAGNATFSETSQKNRKLLIFRQFFYQQILPAHRVARLQHFFRAMARQ